MYKFIFGTSILMLGIVSSCRVNKNLNPDPRLDVGYVISPDSADLSIFAQIERTLCFGKCPTYKFTIYHSGRAEYHGLANVDSIGTFTGTVTQEQATALLETAQKIKFQNMESVYDNPQVTDLPSTTTTLNLGERQPKVVKNRYGGPEKLKELEHAFDQIISQIEWIKVEEAVDER